MAVFNAVSTPQPNVTGQGVVTAFLAKSVVLTSGVGDLDPITFTAGVSANDDIGVSVDSGVSNAGPTGAGTAGSPYVMPVQSITLFAKNWRLQLVYNTPDADSPLPSVSFYA
jgi:hypothetical protein